MDSRTIQYYDDHADELAALYAGSRSGPAKYFKVAFPPGSEILDIGAGSGRDLSVLVREQYEAYGAEPSPRLRSLALQTTGLESRIYAGALPDLFIQIGRKFDGILCSAVFQHIPREEQFDAALDIRNLLKLNGRLLISVPKDRPGIDASVRDEGGRLYAPLVPEELVLLFERLGFHCIGTWSDADSLGRPGISWTTLLFALCSNQALWPIDRIEGVLNPDREVATSRLIQLGETRGTTVPLERSSWVVPGKFLAGAYPCDLIPAQAEEKLRALISSGIRCIVDLTKEDDQSISGLLIPYREMLDKLAAHQSRIIYHRKSIVDLDVPSRDEMRGILDLVDAAIRSDRPVYVHCLGGIGRTGTVVGCWLARHGIATGAAVIGAIRKLRCKDPHAYLASPETSQQRRFVCEWREGD